mgnify:CR=1 FL=1|tara:strand:+ start:395 stop:568 length:174 start_codon:yes stop_codon:yes gene_type:complete
MSKTITFKNGKTMLVKQDVANILHERIVEGCNKFICFEDENKNSYRIINISEIVCIE